MIARVACIVVLLAGITRADDRARAEQYYRAGESAYAKQSFAAAAQDFEEAYKALPIPELAFSAAQAYRRQYRVDPKPEYVERAVTLYRAYLDKVKTGGRVGDAADALTDMQRELDVLIKRGVKFSAEIVAEHTQLNIVVSLGDAPRSLGALREVEEKQQAPAEHVRVLLDDAVVEPFVQINVAPGPHRVHAEAPGYFATAQDVRLRRTRELHPRRGRVAPEAGATGASRPNRARVWRSTGERSA